MTSLYVIMVCIWREKLKEQDTVNTILSFMEEVNTAGSKGNEELHLV